MTHMKARFWATSLGLTAAFALTGCGALSAAPPSNQGDGTSVAAPAGSTPKKPANTAPSRTTENPAPARTSDTQPAITAPVSSIPTTAAPAVSAPVAAPSTGADGTPAPEIPAVTEQPPPATEAPPTENPGTPATEAPAAPSAPTVESPAPGSGGYPVVAPENSPQVGLDTNGKYAPGMKLAAMDQGRLFFAYPEHWNVFATSDTSMSITSTDNYIEGGINIREAGAPEPAMTHTRTVYGQAQGPDHAANVVVGRTDGPFNTDRLSWRLQDPTTGASGLTLGDGRVVDIQLYSIIGEGTPPLTGEQIEQVLDEIPNHPDHLAAQNILGTVHHLG